MVLKMISPVWKMFQKLSLLERKKVNACKGATLAKDMPVWLQRCCPFGKYVILMCVCWLTDMDIMNSLCMVSRHFSCSQQEEARSQYGTSGHPCAS